MAEILHHFGLEGISPHPLNLNIGGIQIQETRRSHEWLKSCTTLDVIPTLKLWGFQGEASKVLSCNTSQAVQDFSHQQYDRHHTSLTSHFWKPTDNPCLETNRKSSYSLNPIIIKLSLAQLQGLSSPLFLIYPGKASFQLFQTPMITSNAEMRW